MGNDSKRFFESKTFWFNAAAVVVAVAGPVVRSAGYTGEVPENLEIYVIPAIALVNVILRFISNQAITLRAP